MSEQSGSNWVARHKIATAFVAIVVVGIVGAATNKPSGPDAAVTKQRSAQHVAAQTEAKPIVPPSRQVTGTAITLGAGTFTGGKDVAVGLYNVTTAPGQSGNFYVSGSDSYNEILGTADNTGVPRIRVRISSGDKIDISGLSQVIFTPVTSQFVTTHTATTLYAGTFIVGQDIGAGRYSAAPGPGQSGNFMVSGSDSYNEILGSDRSYGEVPSLTVDLSNADAIDISGLSSVALTPIN